MFPSQVGIVCPHLNSVGSLMDIGQGLSCGQDRESPLQGIHTSEQSYGGHRQFGQSLNLNL